MRLVKIVKSNVSRDCCYPAGLQQTYMLPCCIPLSCDVHGTSDLGVNWFIPASQTLYHFYRMQLGLTSDRYLKHTAGFATYSYVIIID